jgi:hypothetical protein
MGLLGRTCLILGGATLIRSLVDAGTLPQGWGVTLGLAYACTWALLADRARSPMDATFHLLASLLIAYPLIVESTARFGILTPPLAAVLLLMVTCLHGTVAWRQDLRSVIWMAALASSASGLALMSSRRAIEPFLVVFLLLGLGTYWLTEGRRWRGLRWPTALAADLGILIFTSLAAWPGGIPEAYRGISPGWAMAAASALVLIYVGSFALRLLRQKGTLAAFELTQTVLVLLLGYGGALRVALASGSGTGPLGAGYTLAGLAGYAAALPLRDELEATRPGFRFFTFLGLGLLLLGGPLLLPLGVFASLCGVLGLGTLLVGLQTQRPLLLFQSGLFLLASALLSGLAIWTFRAFLVPQGVASTLPLPGFLSLVSLLAGLGLSIGRRPSATLAAALTHTVQPLVLVLGAVAAGGLGALGIQLCCLTSSPGSVDPGTLAAVRTGMLSTLAVLLAWCGRRIPWLELRWLVYPLLIITALKFLFEDMTVGRPLTLFLGFMCYGLTLMAAPRLLKGPVPPDRDQDSNPLKPEVHP